MFGQVCVLFDDLFKLRDLKTQPPISPGKGHRISSQPAFARDIRRGTVARLLQGNVHQSSPDRITALQARAQHAGCCTPPGLPFREAQWKAIMEFTKQSLNSLALKEYRQAPFLQWAFLSIDHALRYRNRDAKKDSAAYLELARKALEHSRLLARSPFQQRRMFRNLPEKRALERAAKFLAEAFAQSTRFHHDSNPSNLYHARMNLRHAALELIATSQRTGS